MMDNICETEMFFLYGLHGTNHHRVPLFFLTLLCYCLILLVSVSLVVTIILDKNLHEPMYILLYTFCLNELYGTTGFYLKFVWDLLSPVHVISYAGCLLQSLVIYSFGCCDLSILAVMAYDRYVAICRPLEYHSIMSKQRLMKVVCWSWLTPFCLVATNTGCITLLSMSEKYIDRLFCVNGGTVRLACFPVDIFVNNIVVYIIVIIYVLHGLFIALSYIYIIKLCANSVERRAKFMQTCVPHLISLFNFKAIWLYDIMNKRFGSKVLPQSLENFPLIQFLVIPPNMNAFINGFRLTKILNRFLSIITAVA